MGLGNIADLVQLSGQNEKCSYFFLSTGKRSDNPNDPDWVSSAFSHKKAIPLPKLQAAAKKNHQRIASKKKQDIARLQALGPKKIEIEEPSITDEIDMVVDESIPMVEIEVAELNRSKEKTESYRAELNKRNEVI